MSKDPGKSSIAPLQIAVLGMGGIGSTFAFQFARTGHHNVTVIARPGSARLKQLQEDAGIINEKNERADVLVADALDETCPYDLVVVTLLAHQVEAVVPALQRSAARRIQFMFNNFDPEKLRNALGAERCAFGMPFVQAMLDKQGRLNATIGAAGQKCKMNDRHSVEVFAASGLPAVFEPEMLLWLRCHVPLCVAFESASVIAVSKGAGASWAEAMVLARGAQEGWTLIRQLGYKIYPSGKALLHASPAWVVAGILWFMSRIRSFRELLATGAAECNALIGVLVQAAAGTNPTIDIKKIQAMKPNSPWLRKGFLP